MSAATLASLPDALGIWSDVLGVLTLMIPAAAAVCMSWFKHRGSEYVRAQNELRIRLRELEIIERMLEVSQTRQEGAVEILLSESAEPLPLKSTSRTAIPSSEEEQRAA